MLNIIEMEVAIICKKCNESVSSKRALRRHLHSRHPLSHDQSGNIVAEDFRQVFVKTAVEAKTADLPVIDPVISVTVNQTTSVEPIGENVTEVKAASRPSEPQQLRKMIDSVVECLLQEHLRDRTTMSRPTSQITEELEEKFRLCLPREVFVGVVVAAKHFAGTYRPCCPTVVPDVTMS